MARVLAECYRNNWIRVWFACCHLYFLPIHTRLKARVCTKNTSDARHIPRYSTRKHCIISMYLIRRLISQYGWVFLRVGSILATSIHTSQNAINLTNRNTQKHWLVSRLIRCLLYHCFLFTIVKTKIARCAIKRMAIFVLIIETHGVIFHTGRKQVIHSGLWLAVGRAQSCFLSEQIFEIFCLSVFWSQLILQHYGPPVVPYTQVRIGFLLWCR